jgi:hypothetical protein
MILAKKYKTHEGAAKKAAFENAHPTPGNANFHYSVVRFIDGKPDTALFDKAKAGRYHWQIGKDKKAKKAA